MVDLLKWIISDPDITFLAIDMFLLGLLIGYLFM